MRVLKPTLGLSTLFALSGSALLAAQEMPAVTDVRHVAWIWKAEVALPTSGHVVIVDWHTDLGAARRYPRTGSETRSFDAGLHTISGDPPRRPFLVRPHGTRWGLVGQVGTPVFVSSLHYPSLDLGPSSPALRRLIYGAMPPPSGEASGAPSAWQAFVLILPEGASAAGLDLEIAKVPHTGDPMTDLAALAAALGASAWGGQTPHARRYTDW